jgi:D-ribulokinase
MSISSRRADCRRSPSLIHRKLNVFQQAGLCGLGYGVRQIVSAQREQDVALDTIVISGGAGQSPLARQVLADTTGLVVAASTSPEPVLLGAAILGAVAAGRYRDATEAMEAMSSLGGLCMPQKALAAWHENRFDAFEELQRVGRRLRDETIVTEASKPCTRRA